MGIFDNIGNKVMSAGNQISGRAKDAGEQVRLASENQSLNRRIQQVYQEIGENYYNWTRGTASGKPDFEAMCRDIDGYLDQIQANEVEISRLKGQIPCPSCGKMIPQDTAFCPYCGAPVREILRKNEEAADNNAAAPAFCPNCGAPLEPGAKFCTNCGQPVQSAEPAGAPSDSGNDDNSSAEDIPDGTEASSEGKGIGV